VAEPHYFSAAPAPDPGKILIQIRLLSYHGTYTASKNLENEQKLSLVLVFFFCLILRGQIFYKYYLEM
jgi:hypothetical protein